MKKFFIIICLAAGLLGYYFYSLRLVGFRVEFFNVGQGDSTLIFFTNGQKMLVDCGPDRTVLAKLGQTLPFFDRTIDYLVISHPDSDHYGGCVDVLARYQVKNIIQNSEQKNYDPYFGEWTRAVAREGAAVKIIDRGEEMKVGEEDITFLSPDSSLDFPVEKKEGNNLSVVFKLSSPRKSFLFTGDAEIILENALLKKYCSSTPIDCPALHADYLKVGHHGSDSSSGDAFIGAVAPGVAIVPVGKNKFGHPSLRVIKHLERAQIEIWRTDERGDIIVQ